MTRNFLLLFIMAALATGCSLPVSPTGISAPATTEPAVVEPTEQTPTDSPLPPSITPGITVEPVPSATNTVEASAPWIAYIGADGNIWLINPQQGELRQITQDATGMTAGTEIINYSRAAWSSDGKFLAFTREWGKPASSGYQFVTQVVVYGMETGQLKTLVEKTSIPGIAWKPHTHLLAFAMPIDPNYFSNRGSVRNDLANGIWAVDMEGGEVLELVKPERGLALVNPSWSPNGQFLSFEEVVYMEGRGNFAYFNFEEVEYVSWDKAIGGYRWTPDSQSLLYDYLNYAPSGEERIFINNREGTEERQLSPDVENGYASGPVPDPSGSMVAYTVEQMEGQTSKHFIMLQPISGGSPRNMGIFDQPGSISWSADGQTLLFAMGPWDARQVMLLSISDGAARALAQGREPSWQPAAP